MTDMKLNSARIRRERENRAWSQQHLASAADLGLRTIQRIESSGAASYESALAIAACFELPVSDLVAIAQPEKPRSSSWTPLRYLAPLLGTCAVVTVALVSMRSVSAEQVMMDIGVTLENVAEEHEYLSQLLVNSGEGIDLEMEGQFNLNVVASVLDDGEIVIAFKVDELKGEQFVLVGEPRIVTTGGQEAEVAVGAFDGGDTSFQIVVTPEIQ